MIQRLSFKEKIEWLK